MSFLGDLLNPTPTSVEIRGRVLKCQICEHHEFWRRQVRLHESFAIDPRAICYECDYCGYLHWFMPR
ncbi:hypothetical protein F1C16_09395 [Hymenobacter sp. NBH84]|uniref:hypothetical protein n=1 Tax=Hymenobacter sp. NBH84 TaxID=2596915 RepID=UPI00162830A0|nr:hypothetical protein [Hymenobacter sp. NBH84]QNE39753.1 hypothetical protein F1C16_09395 [Hymenobacter sp. NBH84]